MFEMAEESITSDNWTVNGYLTIRWLGESDGYYFESVYFYKEEEKDR